MLRRFKFRSSIVFFFTGVLLPLLLFVGCSSNPSITPDSSTGPLVSQQEVTSPEAANPAELELAIQVGQAIQEACPVADPSDNDARNQCAENLGNLDLLRDAMEETILWGQQRETDHINPNEHETTSFNSLVWRRTYLSTFMVSGEPTVEQQKGLTIIHLPVQFRNQLDLGAFPYPFWHSPKKWEAYQQATEVLLVMKEGKIKGVLRSFEKDKTREVVEREWDGQWMWASQEGQQEPKVTLYKYLFSESNPHVTTLDATYRKFEAAMRPHSCQVCHSPDNANEMKQLLLLNYPNQALTLRHETVRQIQEDLMPPPAGIADPEEKQRLLDLAKAFAEAGDQALSYEGEPITTAAGTAKLSRGS